MTMFHKVFWRSCVVICVLLMAMSGFPFRALAASKGTCGDNLKWKLNYDNEKRGHILVISGTGDMDDYSTESKAPWFPDPFTTMPQTIVGVKVESGVTSIGDYAFYGLGHANDVIIAEGVKEIGAHAFSGLGVYYGINYKIGLPDSLEKIGDYAFYQCLIEEITIPANVVEIGEHAFIWCTDLEQINVDSANDFFRSDNGALIDLANKKVLYYPEGKAYRERVTISSDITTIGEYAFRRAKIGEVVLSSELTSIESNSFTESSIKKILLPASLDFIGSAAFSNCMNLSEITFSGEAPTFEGEVGYVTYHFSKVTATVYYPCDKVSWTEEVMKDYGGTLTWEKKHTELTKEVTRPTCAAQGYTIYTCTSCTDSYMEDYVDALGHIWTNACDTTCDREGCVYTREIVHDYKTIVTEPTCTEQGYTTHTCTVCTDSYEENYVDALGHIWTNACDITCNRKDCNHTREIIHDFDPVVTAPTCVTRGYTTQICLVCGHSYVEDYVAALGHEMGEWAETKAATCTEKGEGKRECSRCDHTETREIAAKGHSYESVVTEPTCTEQGYTTHTCTVCTDSYVENYVDALGHTYISGFCGACGHDIVVVTVRNGLFNVTCDEMDPGTVIWLVVYNGEGRLVAIKSIVLGEALTLPEGKRYMLIFVDDNWVPLRKQREL